MNPAVVRASHNTHPLSRFIESRMPQETPDVV
jgi:hypothetical protein